MNAKIERLITNVDKVKSMVMTIDDAASDLYVDEGELGKLEKLQNLILVLFDEIDIVQTDVKDLADNSRIVDVYLVACENNRKANKGSA